jgi:hypothetical protein
VPQLSRCPFLRLESGVLGHLAEGTPNVGSVENSHSLGDFPAAHRSMIGTTAAIRGTVRAPAVLQRVENRLAEVELGVKQHRPSLGPTWGCPS